MPREVKIMYLKALVWGSIWQNTAGRYCCSEDWVFTLSTCNFRQGLCRRPSLLWQKQNMKLCGAERRRQNLLMQQSTIKTKIKGIWQGQSPIMMLILNMCLLVEKKQKQKTVWKQERENCVNKSKIVHTNGTVLPKMWVKSEHTTGTLTPTQSVSTQLHFKQKYSDIT